MKPTLSLWIALLPILGGGISAARAGIDPAADSPPSQRCRASRILGAKPRNVVFILYPSRGVQSNLLPGGRGQRRGVPTGAPA